MGLVLRLLPAEQSRGVRVPKTVRIDDDLAIRQECEFVGPRGQRMFVSRSAPLGPAVAGVVICSPIHAEFPKNYRREVLLSRTLAARGFAVQRFHYRGAGHSDGDSSQLSLQTMVEDARAATQQFIESTGLSEVAFLGTRLGGLVAAAVAAGFDAAPLALWEPVLEPSTYFREVLRARLMSELRQGTGDGNSVQSLLDQLRTTGLVDVLGYPVERELYDSLVGRELEGGIGTHPRPILLLQFSLAKELRTEYLSLAQRLRAREFPVREAVVGSDEGWWFIQDAWQADTATSQGTPVEITADWLVECRGAVGVER